MVLTGEKILDLFGLLLDIFQVVARKKVRQRTIQAKDMK